MQYRVTFTTTDSKIIRRLKEFNGTRLDSLAIEHEDDLPPIQGTLVPGSTDADRLLYLLSDGMPHRTDEICAKVYGLNKKGIARIASRASDLRKRGHDIPMAKADEHNSKLYWYRLIQPAT